MVLVYPPPTFLGYDASGGNLLWSQSEWKAVMAYAEERAAPPHRRNTASPSQPFWLCMALGSQAVTLSSQGDLGC